MFCLLLVERIRLRFCSILFHMDSILVFFFVLFCIVHCRILFVQFIILFSRACFVALFVFVGFVLVLFFVWLLGDCENRKIES